MKNIQILDCTLRDGGRIINCEFEDKVISGISMDLAEAGIDIVEIGFLRGKNLVEYRGNSTFFTTTEQIQPLIPSSIKRPMYVAFVDYGMYDFECLEPCDGKSISGIRVGFTKKQFDTQREDIMKELYQIKKKGYKLFIQGVNSLAYNDRELLDLIDMVNEIKPYSFGIVDTYGSMYLEDLVHIYNLIDHNLDLDVCVDVHSHNNFQSSFAFAQEIIRLADGKRKIILDATLNGMGKCAGNLNTELIVDFLNRKKNRDYDLDKILDSIDRYLLPIREKCDWGYSIPAFMAGIYKSHPNNIIYLTEKYRLNSRDIKYIISSIDEEKRQRYDYDNIQRIYQEYNSNVINDEQTLVRLRESLNGRNVVVLAPGRTIYTYQETIKKYIDNENAVVISINFVPKEVNTDYLFYANTIHWEKVCEDVDVTKCILTSNIHTKVEKTLLVDYSSLIVEDSKLYDNSTIMLLNLLKRMYVKNIFVAGFDGLSETEKNYVDNSFLNTGHGLSIQENNKIVKNLYNNFKEKVKDTIEVSLITPSIYSE